jgi:hypothetical protein
VNEVDAERLRDIADLADAATPGPWVADPPNPKLGQPTEIVGPGISAAGGEVGACYLDADAAFIAAARSVDYRELADLVEAERARLREAVKALPGWRDPRYSGMYESPGLVDRNAVLALFEGDAEPPA